MGTEIQNLIAKLDELIELLKTDREVHWCNWMDRAKQKLENSDYAGVEDLLGAYGGMGSFNDLVISQSTKDGEIIWELDSQAKNKQLDVLRSSIWEMAMWLKQNHEIQEK
jgi:hypothetical protein